MKKLAIPFALGVAVLFAATTAPAHRSVAHADCANASTSFTPLIDLHSGTYQGYRGGLYPAGHDAPTAKYLKQGLAAAKRVRPVDGKIVLLSIGMSNTTQEWQAFMQLVRTSQLATPVTLVDGAQGGQDAEIVTNPSATYWSNAEQRLRAAD